MSRETKEESGIAKGSGIWRTRSLFYGGGRSDEPDPVALHTPTVWSGPCRSGLGVAPVDVLCSTGSTEPSGRAA